MAGKIVSIMSQSPTADPGRRSFEEELTAELLLVSGIGLTVVPDLSLLDHSETGLLCLQGIRGDMVVLSWRPAVDSYRLLAEKQVLGQFGRRARQAALPEPTLTSWSDEASRRRTIYCFDLDDYAHAYQVREEIDALRLANFAPLIALVPPPVSPPKEHPLAVAPEKLGPPNPSSAPQPLAEIRAADEEHAWDRALEGLVDELERLDL